MTVGVGRNVLRQGFKLSETHAGAYGLVDDHALPPAVGVAHGRLARGAVKTAAVVQIEDDIHVGFGDQGLDAAHSGIFRILGAEGGEFAVHVAVQPARTLDNGRKVEVGHNAQSALAEAVTGGQERGGGKTAGFVALDTPHHQHHRRSPAQLGHGEIGRGGRRGDGEQVAGGQAGRAEAKKAGEHRHAPDRAEKG